MTDRLAYIENYVANIDKSNFLDPSPVLCCHIQLFPKYSASPICLFVPFLQLNSVLLRSTALKGLDGTAAGMVQSDLRIERERLRRKMK